MSRVSAFENTPFTSSPNTAPTIGAADGFPSRHCSSPALFLFLVSCYISGKALPEYSICPNALTPTALSASFFSFEPLPFFSS